MKKTVAGGACFKARNPEAGAPVLLFALPAPVSGEYAPGGMRICFEAARREVRERAAREKPRNTLISSPGRISVPEEYSTEGTRRPGC